MRHRLSGTARYALCSRVVRQLYLILPISNRRIVTQYLLIILTRIETFQCCRTQQWSRFGLSDVVNLTYFKSNSAWPSLLGSCNEYQQQLALQSCSARRGLRNLSDHLRSSTLVAQERTLPCNSSRRRSVITLSLTSVRHSETKSRDATSKWNECPQFLTQALSSQQTHTHTHTHVGLCCPHMWSRNKINGR